MKKKIIVYSLIAVLAIVFMAVVIFITSIGGQEIASGKYEIKGYEDYPNAYIIVENEQIQFYNIDLNLIYQEYQIESYKKMVENNVSFNFLESEVDKLSDLNEMFVNKAYEIDYAEENKVGTFTYTHFCMSEKGMFGLVLRYDSFHKTIQIKSPVIDLTFDKKWFF